MITDNNVQWRVKRINSFADILTDIATDSEVVAGESDEKVVTPKKLKKYYLPLAGGVMNGIIQGLTAEYGNTTNYTVVGDGTGEIRISSKSADGTVDGGGLYLYPVNLETDDGQVAGGFALKAILEDGSDILLQGNNLGRLLWGGKDIIPVMNAIGHNAIYRGKYLGSALTSAQSATIRAGEFDDLYIGDYWTIGGVNYRIAAFDYYYNCGDTACTTHHVVVVPDTVLYTAQMNAGNVTTGAYVGSAMYTTNLAQAKTTIQNAFGTDHLLTIRQYFQNAVTNGYTTGGTWCDAVVWLMNEINVYGCKVFGDCIQGTNWANRYYIDNSQYPLFAMNPRMIHTRQTYWLRDVATSAGFANVYYHGYCNSYYSSNSYGVRPAFLVY